MKWIDKILDNKTERSIAFFWQLVGPLFILCTFALSPQNYLLFFTGVVGLLLSAKYRNVGFVASVLILSGVSIFEFIDSNSFQLWTLGLDVSYALAFFITAQSAARYQVLVFSLFSQLDTKSAFVSNLEEELNKTRLETQTHQIKVQEKIDFLQKQLEEIQSEQSSLLVLNEVLRKTTATHMQKKDVLTEELYQLQNRLSLELAEKETLKTKLSETDLSAHKQLVDELRQVRCDQEQTHTIKETLERLHTYEQQRANAALAQLATLETEQSELSQKLVHVNNEWAQTRAQLESALAEKENIAQKIVPLETELGQVRSELNAEKERLSQAQIALAEKERNQIALEETLNNQVVIAQPSQTEHLYHQLRAQFEEKNAVLHQTRSELFKLDNAYQTLQIEVAQMDIGIPRDVMLELEKEFDALEEENHNLQNIITTLSESKTSVKKKSE